MSAAGWFRWASAVVMLAVGGLLASGIGGAEAPDTPGDFPAPRVAAGDNPCLKYLPSDWWLVGNFDCKGYLALLTQFEEDGENPLRAMMEQYMQMVRQLTGLDPQRNVDYVTFFASGDIEDAPGVLVAIKGTFANETVSARLTNAFGPGQHSQHKGRTIHTNGTAGYCLPEPSTLLFGNVEMLTAGIDAVTAPARKMPDALAKTLARTNGRSIIWGAVRPQAIFDVRAVADALRVRPVLNAALRPTECVSLFAEGAPDGIVARAMATLPHGADARRLATYLRRRKDALLHREGANVFVSSFLLLSDVAQRGRHVRGSLHLTIEGLEKLWNTKLVLKDGAQAGEPEAAATLGARSARSEKAGQ